VYRYGWERDDESKKIPFEHNLWVFMSFLRLTVVSISIQFSFYSVRTLPFPKTNAHTTELPLPHISRSWLVQRALKKGHVQHFCLLSFFFLRIITFSMLCYDIYVQCCSLTESFMTFLSLFLLMDFYGFFQS
jgi:hypothetical protein